MRYRRRIWCEMLPCTELAEPRALGLLRRFSLAPIIAVWPVTPVADLARAIAAIQGEGLPVAIWPMLADRDGRWANARNAEVFARFAEARLGELRRLGCQPGEVAIDLEPSIEEMRATLAKRATHAHASPIIVDPRAFTAAHARIGALVDALHLTTATTARDARPEVSAAVPPTVLLDPLGDGPRPYQELLGTPVDGIAWDHVSVMLYTSMLEGWSRGVFRRDDARAFLGFGAAAAAARFGDRAGVSLGAVGVGAFGNEPTYRTPGELAEDVAITTAAGVDDLTLFDLGGTLRRPDPEAWLEVFTATPPAREIPPPTLRLRAALAGARLAGGAFARLGGILGRRGARPLARPGR